MTKWVYHFGGGTADGAAEMKNLLGGKGANLAEMSRLGLNVPPGFTCTTEVCTAFYANDRAYPDGFEAQVQEGLNQLEELAGKKFGDTRDPLLLSIRSGARASMPGMMDTVLNLGLNDETVKGLVERTGDERFAYDSYRRFIQMYGNVVLDVDHYLFEDELDKMKAEKGAKLDTDLTADDLKALVKKYKAVVREGHRRGLPRRADQADVGWHRRGLRILDEPARDHLSPSARPSCGLGHGGQRADHGIRKHG